MNKLLFSLITTCAFVGFASAAHASAYTFTVQEANTNGTQFNAGAGALSGYNTISASFSYNGPLNFDDPASQNGNSGGDLNSAFFGANAVNIYGYSGSGTLGAPANANFNSLANFLASSGSASGFQYGSLFTVDLGNLAAGTILTITHDDGVSLSGAGYSGSLTSGPTTAVTETVDITKGGDYTLYYARENGTPSVLEVAVPEPSTFAVFGVGLAGLAFLSRRKFV